jgi:hypothetical protein
MKRVGLIFAMLIGSSAMAHADTIAIKVKSLLCMSCAKTMQRQFHDLGAYNITMTFSTRVYGFKIPNAVTTSQIQAIVTAQGYAVEAYTRTSP